MNMESILSGIIKKQYIRGWDKSSSVRQSPIPISIYYKIALLVLSPILPQILSPSVTISPNLLSLTSISKYLRPILKIVSISSEPSSILPLRPPHWDSCNKVYWWILSLFRISWSKELKTCFRLKEIIQIFPQCILIVIF